MLGNIFEYFLETGSNDGRLAVLGATSGDTGSAAIYGLRNKRGMDCIILFPHNRVSPLQERQMTTVLDSNIHCVAIENGTFDDCQDIVKASFGNTTFRDEVHLGAVNSINWCRVLAQTTYYFWSYFRIQEHVQQKNGDSKTSPTPVSYSVPTGNFGDVLAGYYAKQMGLPVDKLIVATNENDILHRFFTKGEYHREDIQDSISPSMDICVSSNFERYLYHLAQNSPKQLQEWMNQFESTHQLTLTEPWLQQAQGDFLSARADTTTTLQVIRDYYTQYNYLLCPHSAVGVSAIHQLNMVQPYVVCLATAHAGKFPDAVARALQPLPLPPPPPQLAALETLPTRCALCPKDATVVQAFMEKRIQDRIQADEKGVVSTNASWQQQVLEQGPRWVWTAAVVGTAAVVIQMMLSNKKRT
jgi:threonine synthase